jgi:hypothetical protein
MFQEPKKTKNQERGREWVWRLMGLGASLGLLGPLVSDTSIVHELPSPRLDPRVDIVSMFQEPKKTKNQEGVNRCIGLNGK